MRKKILFAIAPLFFLACNFLFPATKQDEKQLPTQPEAASDQSTSSFTIVRIHTQDGDLLTQLTAETQKAKELNQNPFIEFDATWCPPCQAIDASLKAKDQLTVKAFDGIYLIRADVDEWGWGDGKKFKFEAIPIYYQLDDGGNPTGATVDGGAWDEDIPKNFAPVLDAFFHTQ
jgi:thiol-disulfide isomerase/thioredoxin